MWCVARQAHFHMVNAYQNRWYRCAWEWTLPHFSSLSPFPSPRYRNSQKSLVVQGDPHTISPKDKRLAGWPHPRCRPCRWGTAWQCSRLEKKARIRSSGLLLRILSRDLLRQRVQPLVNHFSNQQLQIEQKLSAKRSSAHLKEDLLGRGPPKTM